MILFIDIFYSWQILIRMGTLRTLIYLWNFYLRFLWIIRSMLRYFFELFVYFFSLDRRRKSAIIWIFTSVLSIWIKHFILCYSCSWCFSLHCLIFVTIVNTFWKIKIFICFTISRWIWLRIFYLWLFIIWKAVRSASLRIHLTF